MKNQHPQATAFPMTSLEIQREDLKKPGCEWDVA